MPSRQTRTLATFIFVKRYRTFAGFLFAMTALLGWFIFLRPAIQKFNVARDALFEVRIERIAQQRYLAAVQTVRSRIESISEEDREKLRASIPERIDLPQLWTSFNAMAQESGMELGSITVTPVVATADVVAHNSGIVPVMVEIVVRGSGYSTFKRLLQTLEESVPISKVREWMFKPEIEEFEIFLNIYTLPDTSPSL